MTIHDQIAAKFAAVVRDEGDMHAYQTTCVDFMDANPFSALLVAIGLGKTVSTLTLLSRLLQRSFDEKILIIAPLRVATDVWPTEIGLWRHTAWMNATLLRADEDDPRLVAARRLDVTKREDRNFAIDCLKTIDYTDDQIKAAVGKLHETMTRHAIMSELASNSASIHIVNREAVEWLVYFWKEKWPYRTVVIDELSSFKDHTSKRFKALAKVRNTPGMITRFHGLAAMPAAEGYEGLFAQMFLLDGGKRLGKNITAYRNEHFVYNKYSMKYKLRPNGEAPLLAKIADICMVMQAKDYLKRDAPTILQRKVKLAKPHMDLIRKLERDFLITMPNGAEIEAKTAACLTSMLLQMASGCLYETLRVEDWDTDDLKKVKKVHHIHEHKIDALREIYEDAQNAGEPLLVAYFFKSSLARLLKAFPKAQVYKEGESIKAWNKGDIPMLLIHPQSCQFGLNLQHGGHILIFFDLVWSLEYYTQTIGRIDRQGQTKPVIVQLLIAEGTRDEDVSEALTAKEDVQEKMFVILKRLIAKLRRGPEKQAQFADVAL